VCCFYFPPPRKIPGWRLFFRIQLGENRCSVAPENPGHY
jgi:hypothetical protein